MCIDLLLVFGWVFSLKRGLAQLDLLEQEDEDEGGAAVVALSKS